MTFHGFLSRAGVFEIYANSQVFLLPTIASEGFPKVIAEAINFGCIPIASNISSIRQYVKDGENGFLLDEVVPERLREHIQKILRINDEDYSQLMSQRNDIIPKFTYKNYNNRIKTEII